MPYYCSAYNCKNQRKAGGDVTFHLFPKDPARREAWTAATRRKDWQPTKYTVLCSEHFTLNCFEERNGRRFLKFNATPTVFDFPKHLRKSVHPRRILRRQLPKEQVSVESTSAVPVEEKQEPLRSGRRRHNLRRQITQGQMREESTSDVHLDDVKEEHSCHGSRERLPQDQAQEESTPATHLEEEDKEEKSVLGQDALQHHTYAFNNSIKCINHLQDTETPVENPNKKLKLDEITRKEPELSKLQAVIKDLKQSGLGNADAITMIENTFEGVLSDLLGQMAAPGNKYNDKIKRFSRTLLFYSPRAYRFLRKLVRLPHEITVRRWSSSVNGRPGFTQESLTLIAKEVEQSKRKLLCCLMLDELSIVKGVEWDGKENVGYVDVGQGNLQDDMVPVASQALVVMATAINGSWKLPVGYFLIDAMSGVEKADVVKLSLSKLHDTGVRCVAVTCNGSASYIAMLNALGCRIRADGMKCYFQHPCDPNLRVHAILDTCHMLKLMKNLLVEKSVIIDTFNENKIKWDHICRLRDLQQTGGLKAANQQRKNLIHYHNQKLKVALAAPTFSTAVAKALLQGRELNLPGFEDADGTASFMVAIDRLFDTMNSCHPFAKGKKAPVRTSSKAYLLKVFNHAKSLLLLLADTAGKSLHLTSRKVPMLGLLLNIASITSLAEIYVWGSKPVLTNLLTSKLSKGHLEQFFSSIHKNLGNNEQLTALTFRSSYWKTLLRSIDLPSIGNCFPGDNTNVPSLNTTEYDSDPDDTLRSLALLSPLSEHAVEYMAGYVVKAVLDQWNCPDCVEIVTTTRQEGPVSCATLAILRNNGVVMQPSEEVTVLLRLAEQVFRITTRCCPPTQRNTMELFVNEMMFLLLDKPIFRHNHLFISSEISDFSHGATLVRLLLQNFFQFHCSHLFQGFMISPLCST